MVSGPGAEEGEHFARAAEISSAVRAVQPAKGPRKVRRKKVTMQGVINLGGGGSIGE